jgi:hypothetical protein
MTKKTGRFICRATGTAVGGRISQPGARPTWDRRDEAPEHAEPPPGAKRRYDAGNRQYCLSLPPGDYEAEDDQELGLMRLNRVGGVVGHEPKFICALPGGSYEVETDEAGAHLYLLPEDENPREALPEAEAQQDESWRRGSRSLPARLRAMNARHREHYRRDDDDDDDDKRRSRTTADERRQLDMFLTKGIVAGNLDDTSETMIARLRAQNALNRAHYEQKGD